MSRETLRGVNERGSSHLLSNLLFDGHGESRNLKPVTLFITGVAIGTVSLELGGRAINSAKRVFSPRLPKHVRDVR